MIILLHIELLLIFFTTFSFPCSVLYVQYVFTHMGIWSFFLEVSTHNLGPTLIVKPERCDRFIVLIVSKLRITSVGSF